MSLFGNCNCKDKIKALETKILALENKQAATDAKLLVLEDKLNAVGFMAAEGQQGALETKELREHVFPFYAINDTGCAEIVRKVAALP